MNNLKQQILRYWIAMNASAFDAAVHSCVAFFGVAGAHAAFDAVPALNLQQFAAVFFIAFGRAILKFLDNNPLSKLFPAPAHDDTLERLNRELVEAPDPKTT